MFAYLVTKKAEKSARKQLYSADNYLRTAKENHTMEIIRGRLDDISRTASIEGTSSRMSSLSLAHSDRISPTTPFSLVVLTNDAVDMQVIK